jgi:hypothetical protein
LAEGTETFIWIPSSEPRRYGGAFAALATILMVCACVVGNSPMRGFVDAFSRKGIGAERSTAAERPIVAEFYQRCFGVELPESSVNVALS